MTSKDCNNCTHCLKSVSVGFTVATCEKLHKVIDVQTTLKPLTTPKWCPMSSVHPTILASMAAMVPPPTDTQRLEWLLPVVSGGISAEADRRTLALGTALISGLEGRALIDKAMTL